MPRKKKTETEETQENLTVSLKRDEEGLLEGVEYIKNDQGYIDWRRMINPDHIVLNRQRKDEIEKEYGKPFSDIEKIFNEDETQIDDKFKLILLAGFKELARLRGYTSVEYPFTVAHPEFVSTRCRINWIGNYETNGEKSSFEDGADAHFNNTFSWYGNYLTTAATNRAFVRAVRNFLGVHIVGSDEIGPNGERTDRGSEQTTTVNPYEETISRLSSKKGDAVRVAAEELGITFEELKQKCVSQKMKGAEEWISFSDITGNNALVILNALEKKKEELGK